MQILNVFMFYSPYLVHASIARRLRTVYAQVNGA